MRLSSRSSCQIPFGGRFPIWPGTSNLPKSLRVRSSAPDNLHLTVKFLGEIDDRDVSRICNVLKGIESSGAIVLIPDGIHCLPERGPVRTICIGLKGDLARLQALYGNIEGVCEELGVRRERRRFLPHITLARLRRTLPTSVRTSIERVELRNSPGQFEAREFVLMQSILEPQGAIYSCGSLSPRMAHRF